MVNFSQHYFEVKKRILLFC